ncbi:MAGE protein [Lasallia pustulata]|nr:MAGE protein [Lasallia pustulata]
MSSQAMTNGDKPQSEFINHLASYPVVSDSINTFKSNPYGQKSIDIADASYNSFVKPVLPYAKGPYGYVKPYVTKADQVASSGLTKVDETFPIVKEDTQKIKSTVFDYALYPFKLAGESKDYVFKTYDSEYKKCGGDGLISGGKAMITTSLVVTSDSLAWLSSFLGQKKEQTKDVAQEKSGQANAYMQEKSGQANSYMQEKAGQAKSVAKDKTGN